MHLLNSFSVNMVTGQCSVDFIPLNGPQAASEMFCHCVDDEGHLNGVINAIGHADTDKIVRDMLDQFAGDSDPLPEGQRVNVSLSPGQTAVLAQYMGPRLPEGTTQLPEDAKIVFWLVRIRRLNG